MTNASIIVQRHYSKKHIMKPVSKKIKYMILGAMIVPCFGRLNLHGTGNEHDYYRLIVPLFIGGIAGYLIGVMKDKWLVLNTDLIKKNKNLVEKINEQKQTDEELRQSEERYRTILESIEDAYFEVNLSGKLTFFSNSLCKIIGLSRDELMGLKNREYMDEDTAKRANEIYVKVFETAKPFKGFEYQIQRGHVKKYVTTSVSLLLDSKNKPIGFRGILSDITNQKKNEKEKVKLQEQLKQAQKMESIGRLAGGVAHDYNNALTAIMGFTDLAIMDADPTGPLHADLCQVLKAGKRAKDITRQLLAFARKQTIAPKVLDLNENVESMLKMLRRLIGEDIDLVWLPGKNLLNVKMDPSQIDQILVNLCVNARDAIEGVGKITIETGTMVFDSAYCADHAGFMPGEFIMLAVSDNGCGMDKAILDNIFEPFFTTKTIDKGTGLGLATIYGIVKQNNGFINVYSEPGNGTTIKIYLPQHEGKAVEIQEGITGTIPQGHGETILVVEDDLSILKLAQKILEGLNYNVLIADKPKEAMKIAKEHTDKIHLLISDVIMPEMNGRELSEYLQSFYPDLKCIFMSGYTANTIAHHGVLDEGMHFVQKPFSKKDLATIIRKVLDENEVLLKKE